jgi:lipopolysaccharide/colanic/teichoic acid biosynthesis glycosyltransferase/membrane-associated phospholipid phosphatase
MFEFLNQINNLDIKISLWINSKNNEFFDFIMFNASEPNTWIPIYILTIWFIFKKFKKNGIVVLAALFAVISLTDSITFLIMKPLFAVLRPCHNLDIVGNLHLLSNICGGKYGFASSHAANTFGMAMFLYLIFGKKYPIVKIGFVIAFLVCYSRVYLGVHYVSDVLVGAILGVFIAKGIYMFIKHIYKNFGKIAKNKIMVLGNKYTFTTLELEQLNKQFSNIQTILNKDSNTLNTINKIENYLKNGFNTIVLNTKTKVDNEIIKYLTNLKVNSKKKIKLLVIEHFLEEYLHKCYIPDDNNSLHYLDDIVKFTILQKLQKNIFDIIVLIPLFIIFILTKPFIKKQIKKQSVGDLYFKQLRVGLNNKEFLCIKFRSMHKHNTDDNVRTATKDDDRIFNFGKSLRQTRLDELPQIFNVLKGQMSLIGPRAEWVKLTSDYEKQIPYYNQRHIISPGITGWAQVMFVQGRNKDDTKQKLMYDLYYIKHYSIWLDLQIIYKTIQIVFSKKGV